MPSDLLLQFVSASPVGNQLGTPYAVWIYRLSWTKTPPWRAPGQPNVASLRIALEFSRRIPVQDPAQYPNSPEIQATKVDTPVSGDIQFVYQDFSSAPASPINFGFVAPAAQDTFCPLRLVQRPASETPWAILPFKIRADGDESQQQLVTGPSAVCLNSSGDSTVLVHSSRSLLKATHVPLDVPDGGSFTGRAKLSFIRQLMLQPGELDALLQLSSSKQTELSHSDLLQLAPLLRPYEKGPAPSPMPPISVFATIPTEVLRGFGSALVQARRQAISHQPKSSTYFSAVTGLPDTMQSLLQAAMTATKWLEASTTLLPSPIGMLNLERLEMAPAGIERGELVATIPLAPGEKTAVVQKEWSVTTKEFTSIVTDSLENISETGVTDNTELAQSTTSQIQHGNQFNITGTVSGGIPLISGSATSTFAAQDSSSQSATDSRKHAVSVTQKASSRTKQEHKVTISTTTVTGTSETTTRELVNPSKTDPIRIDYFSLMRKWRVRLYRYGLRLTYDIVIPEPAAEFRKAYAELASLQGQIGPFEFPVTHEYVATASYQDLQKLADQYGAALPLPPAALPPVTASATPAAGDGWHFVQLSFEVPADYQVTEVHLFVDVGGLAGKGNIIVVVETIPSRHDIPNNGGQFDELLTQKYGFLKWAIGKQVVNLNFVDAGPVFVGLTVSIEPTDAIKQQWQNDVWNVLYNAAQTQYYAQQQEIGARITQLTDQLSNVDTLTLRREESDEIMKGALRFLLGVGYEYMDDVVDTAVKTSDSATDPVHGVAFTSNKVAINALQLFAVTDFESDVRFINQAIEWENVVSFLYSYFWDMPESWDFIRRIKHPDPTRQAFLRAGSARVVLTVRKGWEAAWLSYVDGIPPNQQTPRLTIAQEIAAYDDRNYPGIPPANPGRSAVRLEDEVYTTSITELPPPGMALPLTNVEIAVDSSAGFIVGGRVVIDSVMHTDPSNTFGWQEATTIVAVRPGFITVASIQFEHGGDDVAYVVVEPGEQGVLIAEWNEYTPSSGTDIAVTSNLATIA